jgi:hypothetical protein
MYLDHEGHCKTKISPSWDQPNTRVHIHTIYYCRVSDFVYWFLSFFLSFWSRVSCLMNLFIWTKIPFLQIPFSIKPQSQNHLDTLPPPAPMDDVKYLRVDLNPRILKICVLWMSVWNISGNYVLVPVKFNWIEIFENHSWNLHILISAGKDLGTRVWSCSLDFIHFHW